MVRTYQIGFLQLPSLLGVDRIVVASDLGLAAS